MALLQNPKGLWCSSLIGVCQRPHSAFLSATATLSTIGSAGSYGPSSKAAYPPARPVEEPSLVLGLTQNQHVFRSLSKWTGITHPSEEDVYVASKIQRVPLGVPSASLFFTLEGISQHATSLDH